LEGLLKKGVWPGFSERGAKTQGYPIRDLILKILLRHRFYRLFSEAFSWRGLAKKAQG